MGAGAYVWIFNRPESQSPCLDVPAAKKLIEALQKFVEEAEEGSLHEAAVYDE
jgi:hypothetical protein